MWMHTLGHILHEYFVKDIKIIQMKTLSLRRWIFMELSQILMWWLTVIIVKATLSLKYVSEDNSDYLFRLLERMSWLL